MLTEQEQQKILARKGDVRGVVFQTDANYVIKKGGEEALRKVEAQLKQWGVGIRYHAVKPMAWYPVSWRAFSLLAIKEVMDWQDEQIREMGANAPKVSIIVKLFFKLFPDIEKFAQQIPYYWRKHYTLGSLEVANLDQQNKELTLHLKDFAFHPTQCKYYEGYFEKTTKLTRPEGSEVHCQERQCVFKDNAPFCIYRLTWTK